MQSEGQGQLVSDGQRFKGVYLLAPHAYDIIYGPEQRQAIEQMIEIVAPLQTAAAIEADPSPLAEVDVILSGWGCARLAEPLLAAAPCLKAVFYGAGSIRSLVTDEFWARGIPITTAYTGNAVPVAEYSLSQILFGLKSGWQHVMACREAHGRIRLPVAGGYKSTVGLVSLGAIGRLVAGRLATFDVQVIAYDPFVPAGEAAKLGVELVSLEEVFQRADVVSLHTPWLPETEGMITGAHFAAMKPYSTFINTSRGAVVRETELIEVLQGRPDLVAVLDVTYPEPPVPDSPLYTLPNAILTPHIAGSMDTECRRMGQMMVDELCRFLAGEPLRFALTRAQVERMA